MSRTPAASTTKLQAVSPNMSGVANRPASFEKPHPGNATPRSCHCSRSPDVHMAASRRLLTPSLLMISET